MLLPVLNRAVTIPDFHHTVIVAKRIHDNDIIVIFIENLKKQQKQMLSVKFIFNSVYCVFCLIFYALKV